MGMKEQVSRFGTLSAEQQKFVLAALVGLPLTWMRLRLFGLKAFKDVKPRATGTRALPHAEVVQLALLVRAAARHSPAPNTCLTRALVLAGLLNGRGIEATLRIGVRVAEGKLLAHAWVEHAGVAIDDDQEFGKRFAPFTELPPLSAFPR
jgi:hypothetical protein